MKLYIHNKILYVQVKVGVAYFTYNLLFIRLLHEKRLFVVHFSQLTEGFLQRSYAVVDPGKADGIVEKPKSSDTESATFFKTSKKILDVHGKL